MTKVKRVGIVDAYLTFRRFHWAENPEAQTKGKGVHLLYAQIGGVPLQTVMAKSIGVPATCALAGCVKSGEAKSFTRKGKVVQFFPVLEHKGCIRDALGAAVSAGLLVVVDSRVYLPADAPKRRNAPDDRAVDSVMTKLGLA